MKNLTLIWCCDDEVGEAQGILDETGKLLGAWSTNDGNWRCEYFAPFMKKLGFKISERKATEKEIKLLKKFFGL